MPTGGCHPTMCTMRREAVGGEALLLRVSVAGRGGRERCGQGGWGQSILGHLQPVRPQFEAPRVRIRTAVYGGQGPRQGEAELQESLVLV